MSILLIPVILCSCYLIMVSLCICERMTPKTSHFIRAMIVLIGGSGAWALCKVVMTGWGDSTIELLQAGMIILAAIILGSMPRIKVCQEDPSLRSSRKIGQGR